MRRFNLGQFFQGQRGATAVEFALVLPVVLLILLGCFEIPRFVMVYQKMSRASAGVADLVAQADEPLTANQMKDIFTAATLMMSPYDVVKDGRIYVSSINNPAGAGVVMTWQVNNSGTVTTPSKLGVMLSNPTSKMPASLAPGSNEEVLAAEVFYNYTPVFKNYIYSGSQLYRISYTRPRNKNLMTMPVL